MNSLRLLVVVLALASCGTPGTAESTADLSLFGLTPPNAEEQVALTAFRGTRACEDLENKIEDTASLQVRASLEQAYQAAVFAWKARHRPDIDVYRGGVPGSSWNTAGSGAGGSGGGAGTVTQAPSGPTDFTTTNNQVQGVDEADFVKNDGTRVFVLSGRSLYTALSWPATALSRQGKLDLEGYPHDLLLDGSNTLVVFSDVYLPELMRLNPAGCVALTCLRATANAVKVTVVDVSNLAAPQVVSAAYYPGRYKTARLLGHSVRVVLTDDVVLPWNRLATWPSNFAHMASLEEVRAAFLDLGARDEAVVRARTLEEWLPSVRLVDGGGSSRAVTIDCAAVATPNGSTELGLTSVVTMDLTQPGTFHRQAVLGSASQVYASETSLYIASHHWWWGWGWFVGTPSQDVTYVHRFDLTDPSAARYVASGRVGGYLKDEFALDEHQGYLRVASTRRDFSRGDFGNWSQVTSVTVLGTSGNKLVTVGQSEDVAHGETVQAVRFLGDQGYVVTFRWVDPLFTFDLSNPLLPKKMGELSVEGFSTYLHPLDATHLLGIGTYVPAGNTFAARALQLAIFDVSDLARPKQTFREIVGTWSVSEAQGEHKAFNYFPSHQRLAVPYTSWRATEAGAAYWEHFVSDLKVYDVDVATGFHLRGSLAMNDVFQFTNSNGWSYAWMPQVRRSIMADDFVYAITDAGLRVANVNDLATPLATVNFDGLN